MNQRHSTTFLMKPINHFIGRKFEIRFTMDYKGFYKVARILWIIIFLIRFWNEEAEVKITFLKLHRKKRLGIHH